MKSYSNPLVALVLLGLVASAAPATFQRTPAGQASATATATGSGTAVVTVWPASFSVVRVARGRADVPVLIVNNGTTDADVSIVPMLTDGAGRPFEASVALFDSGKEQLARAIVSPGNPLRTTLRIRPGDGAFNRWWDPNLPIRGYLDIRSRPVTAKTASISAPREIWISQIQPSAVEAIVLFASLAIAVAVIVVAGKKAATGLPSGPAAVTAESLASRVGLGAGLLNALLALSSLPPLTTFATRETYTLLAAVFAALIAMGAPVSNLLGKISGTPGTVSRLSFSAAAGLVLWGGLGQMALGALLVRELYNAGVLASYSQLLLLGLVGGLAVIVLLYVRKAVENPQAAPSVVPDHMKGAPPAVSSGAGWSVP